MPYQTGTASDSGDVLATLESFLQNAASPTPWSIIQSTTAVSPAQLFIQDQTGELNVQLITNGNDDKFYVHRSESYDSPLSSAESLPGAAALNATFGAHQCDLLGTSYDAYHFYSNFDPAAGPTYCHGVVEVQAGWYRHFGFGTLDKVGTYTGGQYSYGHYHEQGGNSDNLISANHAWPWDGYGTSSISTGRFTVRFLPHQASGWGGALESPERKWAMAHTTSNVTDGDGARVTNMRGGVRQGYYLNHFFEMANSSVYNGFKPLIPIPVFVYDIDANPDEYYLIGYAPDVRYINMDGIQPGQSITIGGDTWDCYPVARKKFDVDNTEGTGLGGFAYKRLT
jgi:hypothetical protein